MALVTIQLIEGLERGHVYADLQTPVSIGREDDNIIQLNDERVSRFHAKIQEDGGRLILTDLDSTNGTRVNGHPVQMRVLRVGDQMSIGRCLLVIGSRDEIAERVEQYRRDVHTAPPASGQKTSASAGDMFRDDPGTSHAGDVDEQGDFGVEHEPQRLFPDGAPEPPTGLRPLQRAEISDCLEYVREQIRTVLQGAYEDPNDTPDGARTMCVDWGHWQQLLRLEMELAVYLKRLAEPEV